MGYLRGLVHGAAVGTVVGLCVAPQEGTRTREQIRGVATSVRGGAQQAVETARRLAPTAQIAARQVGEVVGNVSGKVVKRRGEPEDGALISVNGNVAGRS